MRVHCLQEQSSDPSDEHRRVCSHAPSHRVGTKEPWVAKWPAEWLEIECWTVSTATDQ